MRPGRYSLYIPWGFRPFLLPRIARHASAAAQNRSRVSASIVATTPIRRGSPFPETARKPPQRRGVIRGEMRLGVMVLVLEAVSNGPKW